MKLKKTGLLTKIVVLALLVGLTVMLLGLREQIEEAEAQKKELESAGGKGVPRQRLTRSRQGVPRGGERPK